MRRIGVTVLSVCAFLYVAGQTPAAPDSIRRANAPLVTARFIPDSIGIGDHFRMRLEVTKDIVQQVGFSQWGQDSTRRMLTQYIEILGESPEDTVRIDGRRITIGKEWLVTTFEAGTHGLKHIPVLYVDKNITDTVYARPDSIMVRVGTFEIDTVKQTIYDIKLPLRTPWRFDEIAGWFIFGVLAVALVIAVVHFLRRWKRNKTVFWRGRQSDPPHVEAIRALEALQHQKLWQNSKHKQYYSVLTDIVRTYIERRFGVQAMEMTSDELLQALRGVELAERNRTQLATLLSTADLAKFAKYVPPAEDNEGCYNDAYYFVEDTKIVETEETTEQEKA